MADRTKVELVEAMKKFGFYRSEFLNEINLEHKARNLKISVVLMQDRIVPRWRNTTEEA